MGTIHTAIQRWREAGVTLNPGANADELAALRACLGQPLPDDVAEYFQLANGMPDGYTDEHFASFWSIARVQAEASKPTRDRAARDVAFVDVLVDSWFCSLRVRSGGGVAVHVGSVDAELNSLEEFFGRYLTEPRSLGL